MSREKQVENTASFNTLKSIISFLFATLDNNLCLKYCTFYICKLIFLTSCNILNGHVCALFIWSDHLIHTFPPKHHFLSDFIYFGYCRFAFRCFKSWTETVAFARGNCLMAAFHFNLFCECIHAQAGVGWVLFWDLRIPGSVQGQAGWGLEEPGLVEGVPAHGRGWDDLPGLFQHKPFSDSVTVAVGLGKAGRNMQGGIQEWPQPTAGAQTAAPTAIPPPLPHLRAWHARKISH